jgi:hypothetical protein
MPMDRVGTTRLTVRNKDKRTYADEEPYRSPEAGGMDYAHCGFHVLDRAPASAESFVPDDRMGLTPPERTRARREYGTTTPAVLKY